MLRLRGVVKRAYRVVVSNVFGRYMLEYNDVLKHQGLMRHIRAGTASMILMLLAAGTMVAQIKHQTTALNVNGKSGQTTVVLLDGRTYVDLEILARIGNGSLSFSPNEITLTLSQATDNIQPAAPEPEHVIDSELSQEFMKAGIEEFALMREWASTLAYAIENGYQVNEDWVANYREQAANGLRMASTVATTTADRNAFQLLTNEFEAVRQWCDELVKARERMDTAKYSVAPGSLRQEPLSQKIVACGRFLAQMLGSRTFRDDQSCH